MKIVWDGGDVIYFEFHGGDGENYLTVMQENALPYILGPHPSRKKCADALLDWVNARPGDFTSYYADN